MTASAITHRDQILQHLMTGARLVDIAPSLGVSPQAISKALRTDPEYRDAVEVAMEIRIDQTEKAIESAVDSVDVARARARWQSASWRAEREFPHRWGQRTQVDVTVDIGHALQELAARLSSQAALDGDAERCDDATDCCETGIT